MDTDSNHELRFANIGCNQVIVDSRLPPAPSREKRPKIFEPTYNAHTEYKGYITIKNKKWFYALVSNKSSLEPNKRRTRALMDEFSLNTISQHLIICYTPNTIRGAPYRKDNGDPIHLFTYFDSYVDFYEYMHPFSDTERCFYEVIFGELPQKPHFDVDVSLEAFTQSYPGADFDISCTTLRDAIIQGCIEVLHDLGVQVNIEYDVLIYTSHGSTKHSYHILINNKCHDGHKEAKAFYNLVMTKVTGYTQGKYIEYIDPGVYSPRQQFRIMGSQKVGSGRVKEFVDKFLYRGTEYTHKYCELHSTEQENNLTVLYESLVSFTSGCTTLPSLVPNPTNDIKYLQSQTNLTEQLVNQCFSMLEAHINTKVFKVKEVQGSLILLKRLAPSPCPICDGRIHEHENPFMSVWNGKVYWNCRRAPDAKPLMVGYLEMAYDTNSAQDMSGPDFEEIRLGDKIIKFHIGGEPIQDTINTSTNISPNTPVNVTPSKPTNLILPPGMCIPKIVNTHMEQDVVGRLDRLQKDKERKKYINKEAEDLYGVRKLSNRSSTAWSAGLGSKF